MTDSLESPIEPFSGTWRFADIHMFRSGGIGVTSDFDGIVTGAGPLRHDPIGATM
jgi:hypothetical protein